MLTDFEDFNFGWKFHLGEQSKVSTAEFDDSSWETVNLPHDWSISLPFENKPGLDYHGYLAGGTGWYRKRFRFDNSNELVFLVFDGVYRSCRVWCNGKEAGHHHFGYNGFELDLTPFLVRDGENVLSINVEAPTPSCRWYSGAGINRGVHLLRRRIPYFPRHPLYISSILENDNAEVNAKLNAVLTQNEDFRIEMTVTAPSGSIVYNETRPACKYSEWKFSILNACLWSPETPDLYHCVFSLRDRSGSILDQTKSFFGIRKVEFTQTHGMYLNGKHVPLRGMALHEGFGCLGTAFSLSALKHQLDLAQSIGANAIRTTHNPFPKEIADECDRRGLLLMAEIFDEWHIPKKTYSCGTFFDDHYESSMIEFLHTFRNHPSVIIWSIGNEIWEQGTPECGEIAMKLRKIINREAPGIPVSAGCDHPLEALASGMGEALDVFGINYNFDTYGEITKQMPVFGSETVATLSSRGEYTFDSQGHITGSTEDCQESSYFITEMDGGNLPEAALLFQKNNTYSAGEFVWCLMDYLGEGLHNPKHLRRHEDGTLNFYPVRSSFFGLFDTCGFPKDLAWLYRSAWCETPCAHIMPHWTWSGREGELIPIRVYGNFHTGELRLNGRSLGARFFTDHQDSLHLEWLVPYEPGVLEFTGFDINGNAIMQDSVRTAGEPTLITLETSVPEFSFGELAFITAKITDSAGTVVPSAAHLLEWDVSGAGCFEATDNGNPTSHEPFHTRRRSAFHGMALLVVRAERNEGIVKITVSADGLKTAALQLHNTGMKNYNHQRA